MRRLIALLALCAGCLDDTSDDTLPPDAATELDAPAGDPWRSCELPYVEGDICARVCCEDDDTWANDTGDGVICSVSGRQCKND